MTEERRTTPAEFAAAVDELEADLDMHERAAADIRATLASIRKRLAQAPGARAGKHARSGRRRKLAAVESAAVNE